MNPKGQALVEALFATLLYFTFFTLTIKFGLEHLAHEISEQKKIETVLFKNQHQ